MEADPAETVDLYTRQSCLSVTAVDLATMGATLADGGVNPVTGERVVDEQTCRHTLAVMTTAGLYETSGDWLYEVGLPGKSGIGGGIITVSPGKGGLATYSPPLDAAGNSVRGQLAATFLSRRLGLDLFALDPGGVRSPASACAPYSAPARIAATSTRSSAAGHPGRPGGQLGARGPATEQGEVGPLDGGRWWSRAPRGPGPRRSPAASPVEGADPGDERGARRGTVLGHAVDVAHVRRGVAAGVAVGLGRREQGLAQGAERLGGQPLGPRGEGGGIGRAAEDHPVGVVHEVLAVLHRAHQLSGHAHPVELAVEPVGQRLQLAEGGRAVEQVRWAERSQRSSSV